mmetsp:Transcript_13623/g.20424  ORF Transcript_13623/g.20424 Transcript_13623/m.20424 type:complete len:106 (-) Transcript_13623:100-417(-)
MSQKAETVKLIAEFGSTGSEDAFYSVVGVGSGSHSASRTDEQECQSERQRRTELSRAEYLVSMTDAFTKELESIYSDADFSGKADQISSLREAICSDFVDMKNFS